MEETVDLQISGRVAEIVLNRPAKHNALTPAMYEQIAAHCATVNRDDAVYVAIICGAGERAFCAGSDIGGLATYRDPWAWRNRNDYIASIRSLRKPCIAAVKGWALGGGLEIALACDLRVATRSATFGAPEVQLGWTGAGGAAQHLTRLAGYGRAMRYLLTGDRFSAQEAFDMGMIEWLVEPGEELERARRIAAAIAGHSSIATQSVKAAVRSAMDHPVDHGLMIENELMTICFAMAAKDPASNLFGGVQEAGE
nr:enoyl-CoA hydratase [Microbacterium terregens]